MQRLVVILLTVVVLVLIGARLLPPPQTFTRAEPTPGLLQPRACVKEPIEEQAPESVTPAPRPPEFAPGQEVMIELVEPPAERYLSVKTDENDEFYGRLVREESRGKALFDPSLGRAAREFVYQFSNLGMDPPSDVRTFLTTSSGAIAGDTVFQHMRGHSDTEATLR